MNKNIALKALNILIEFIKKILFVCIYIFFFVTLQRKWGYYGTLKQITNQVGAQSETKKAPRCGGSICSGGH